MTDAELIDYHGGPTRLAAKLGWLEGRAIQRIHNWRSRGIPAAVKLERPDLFLLQADAPPLSPPEPPAAGEPSKKFRTTAQVLSVLHPVVAQRLREGIADRAAQEPSPAEE